jgi:hypothetical protein
VNALGVFGPVLIVAGIAGFLIPPRHAQVVAAVGGFFAARAFRYKLADHVLHVVLGLALAAVGALGTVGSVDWKGLR